MNDNRLEDVLKKIIVLDGDVLSLIGEYHKKAEFDDREFLIVLTLSDIRKVLAKFVDGQIGKIELYQWADILELNEYVDYEEGKENEIASLLFQLASPEINGEITIDSCVEMLNKIS